MFGVERSRTPSPERFNKNEKAGEEPKVSTMERKYLNLLRQNKTFDLPAELKKLEKLNKKKK